MVVAANQRPAGQQLSSIFQPAGLPSPQWTVLSNPPALPFHRPGHKVYGIDATALLPVLCPVAHRQLYGSIQPSTAEVRYRKLLAGVQLTRDFFFSYSWPVHQTAQRTFGQAPEQWWGGSASGDEGEGCEGGGAFGSHRVWNEFLSRPLREALAASSGGSTGCGSSDCHRWVVPLAHGFFEQRPLALLGRTLTLTLVARRSRQVGVMLG